MTVEDQWARTLAAMNRAEAPWVACIVAACEAIGYGRVMQIASEAWRNKDPIGALAVGPCYVGRTQAEVETWLLARTVPDGGDAP